MLKYIKYTLLFYWITILSSTAQDKEIKPLVIGDMLPNIIIKNVQNHVQEEINLKDFNGKLLLIDFWGVNCAPCIASFPKLDSLQTKFEKKIKILLVNKESKELVDSIYRERSVGNPYFRLLNRFVSITDDNTLHKLFEHITVPHVVWIDPTGKVRAITSGRFVTEESIEKMLLDETFILPLKQDKPVRLVGQQPVFPQVFPYLQEKLLYYSTLTKTVDKMGGGKLFVVDSINNTVRIERSARDIISFYGEILGGIAVHHPFKTHHFDFGKRVEVITADSSRFFFTEENPNGLGYVEWMTNNRYDYETVLPMMSEQEANRYYKADVDKFFGTKAWIEKRKMRTMVLTRISDEDRIKYIPENDTAGKGTPRAGIEEDGTFYINGLSLEILISKLSENNKEIQFAFSDKTNYKEKVSLRFNAPLTDLALFREELRIKYHLDLIEKDEEVDYLVISDK